MAQRRAIEQIILIAAGMMLAIAVVTVLLNLVLYTFADDVAYYSEK